MKSPSDITTEQNFNVVHMPFLHYRTKLHIDDNIDF